MVCFRNVEVLEKKGEKPKKYDNIKDKIKKEGILELTEEEKNLRKPSMLKTTIKVYI